MVRLLGSRAAAMTALVALAVFLGSCRSAPTTVRTVVFMRSDLTYDDVWQATLVATSAVFPLQEVNREARFLMTGYVYDDVSGGSYRWKVRAKIERVARHWAVRIATDVERLHPGGWNQVGFDERTSLWLLERIDDGIYRKHGPPPPDESLEFVEPDAAAAE